METVEEGPDFAPKEDFPLCVVCGGPAHGLHYGVNSCDACKGFFHRSLHVHSTYTCDSDETCSVRHGKGKMCKACRYQKCLKVGMSKKAIKLGRYPSTQRYNSTLKVGLTKEPSSLFTSEQAENCSETLTDQQPDEKYTVTRQDPKETPGTKTDASQSLFIPSTKRNDTTSPLHRYPSPVSEGDYSPWPQIENSVNYSASTEIDSGHPQISMTPPQSNLPQADVLKGKCNSCLSPLADKTHCMESCTNADISVKNLLEAEQAYFRWPGDTCKSDRLKEAQRHLEHCRLRAETFGQLQFLNEEEHDRLYKQTGIDADERLQFLPRVAEMIELNIRKMILFIKSVSAFSLFSMNDQVSLLKHGRVAFNLLSLTEEVYCDLGVTRISPGFWFCTYDAVRYNRLTAVGDPFAEVLKLSKMLEAQNLTDEERVLLRAIVIITPGSFELDNPSLVCKIHKRLREMIIGCLAKRHKDPQVPFATIMGIMTQLKSTELACNSWMRDVNIKRYFTEDNLLSKEMARGVY